MKRANNLSPEESLRRQAYEAFAKAAQNAGPTDDSAEHLMYGPNFEVFVSIGAGRARRSYLQGQQAVFNRVLSQIMGGEEVSRQSIDFCAEMLRRRQVKVPAAVFNND